MLQRAGSVDRSDGARWSSVRQRLHPPGGRVYEQRNFVYEALNKIDGISVVKPRAAFYIFPKMDVKKFNITDDEQFRP